MFSLHEFWLSVFFGGKVHAVGLAEYTGCLGIFTWNAFLIYTLIAIERVDHFISHLILH